MALILSIETSTLVCSVALYRGSNLLADASVAISQSHSRVLLGLVESILKASSVEMSELNAIAVSKGPGSYTGLRIGVSAAKGLCYAHDIRLIGINTLDAMAKEMNAFNSGNFWLCPMIDARRMEVYCTIYDQNLQPLRGTSAVVVDSNSFSELNPPIGLAIFGDGAAKCLPILSAHLKPELIKDVHPSARGVGLLALEAYEQNRFEDLAYFEPFYLKDFMSGAV